MPPILKFNAQFVFWLQNNTNIAAHHFLLRLQCENFHPHNDCQTFPLCVLFLNRIQSTKWFSITSAYFLLVRDWWGKCRWFKHDVAVFICLFIFISTMHHMFQRRSIRPHLTTRPQLLRFNWSLESSLIFTITSMQK